MIGSFLTRGLVMVFGYAYPAYECYKTVELNRPDIEQLRFWCQYWILVAMLTVSERIGDAFISWVPMYSEAKLAFFIYLWWPKTKGTTYVYESFFRPIVAEHEPEIDRSLSELRTKAGDMAVLYWQKGLSYSQTRVFDVLQYIASQSNPPKPAKKQEQVQVQQPTAPVIHNKRATVPVSTTEDPTSPVSISSSSSHDDDDDDDYDVSEDVSSKGHVVPSSSPAVPNARKVNHVPKASTPLNEAKAMEIESGPKENPQSNPPEIIMEETTRVTRARARKTQSAPSR